MTPVSRQDAVPASGWGAERLDLNAYLRRVGLRDLPEAATPGASQATLHTVHALHRAHLAAIPFDNIDLVLGVPVSLEPGAIVEKLCRHRRGGCCHEHNLLFALVLERLGLPVERLAARVLLGGEGPRPRTHMLLKARIQDEEWLCDVGFGSDGYLDPLPARDGAEVRQYGRRFRVVAHDRFRWSVDALKPDGWTCLYEFTHEPRQPMDVTVAHHFLSTHPRSMLRTAPLLQRLTADTWLHLRGDHLRRVTPSGEAAEHVTRDTLPGVLRDFGIALNPRELAGLRCLFPERAPNGAE
ncbi:arylamine N-acetyltransferase family protein [Streptomyces sp. GSL17-111]|uniref:arylamine N-acetyltransferase family protein n=1 Tax=Streptomyces sp. GSL17-111 TaxID=3121596 RepID=UPI0030F38973